MSSELFKQRFPIVHTYRARERIAGPSVNWPLHITEYHYDYQGDVNFVTRGSDAHIIIEKTVEKKLGEPYNSCLDDLTKFKLNKTIINHILNEA